MIFVEIANDLTGAYSWVDAELVVDRVGGAGAAETWAFATDYSTTATTATGYEVLADLFQWLNDPGREWSGVASWSAAIAAVTNDYVGCTLTASADTWDITPNAAFFGLTECAAVVGGTALGPGAWAGGANLEALSLRDGLRREHGPGGCSPGAGYVAGSQAHASRPLRVEAILADTQQRRLLEALSIASNPRRAYIIDQLQDVAGTPLEDVGYWWQIALGAESPTAAESPLYARWTPSAWRIG